MRSLSAVVLVALASLTLGGVMGALQLVLLGMPLAAAACLAIVLGLCVVTVKVHVAGTASRRNELQLRQLNDQVRQLPKAMVPAPVPAKPVPPERTTAEKLRLVGSFTPAKTVADETVGREAARVSADPDAPFRLFAATRGFGSGPTSATSRRGIALIGSTALADSLAGSGEVHRLHPSVSAAEMDHAQPATLIVEEDALADGPWRGTLEPHGSKLLLEVRVAMAWMRRNGGSIYVLPTAGHRAPGAEAMRREATVLDHEFFAGFSSADPPSLLQVLAGYRKESLR